MVQRLAGVAVPEFEDTVPAQSSEPGLIQSPPHLEKLGVNGAAEQELEFLPFILKKLCSSTKQTSKEGGDPSYKILD